MQGTRCGSVLAILAVLVALPVAGPASADTAIYYSAPENAYGWCAGYAYDRAHSCAFGYCADAGGTDCQVADECGGGWGAVALAEEPARGFGAICGAGDPFSARVWALTHCVVESNTLCWTDSTFQRDGSSASRESDGDFDLTWYVQGMLQMNDYDPGTADGEMGAKTREAIKAFQADMGLAPTGEIDDELFYLLLYSVGGAGHVADIVNRDIVTPRAAQRQLGYAYAPKPAPEQNFTQRMMSLSKEQRMIAIAAVLTASGSPCARPALDATPLADDASGIWNITCAEAAYTLIMSEDGSSIVMGGPTETTPSRSDRTGDRKKAP